jgi:hypothetical integral membrane protein (TIGR02206 family)
VKTEKAPRGIRMIRHENRLRISEMKSNFQLLGLTHLAILGAILALAAVLALLQRCIWPASKGLRLGLASVLLAETLLWDGFLAWHHQLTFPAHLPIELCDLTLYLTVIALFSLSPAVFDLAYYFALAGTSMALLTPDLWEHFPSLSTVQFFFAHGLVVASVLYLVWSRLARPRRGSVMRAMLALNAWAAFDGGFDWIFKTNYMYLRAKPANASLLDLFGPWPWYIVVTEAVALGLFLLLYLPFRQTGSRPS